MLDHQKLFDWLAPLDQLALECDGLTRVVSALLTREGVEHQMHQGALETPEGRIGVHCWIRLPDGAICDFRARMWEWHLFCDLMWQHYKISVPKDLIQF
ncbi:MAG: hypothetical protein PHF42_09580 [Pseudomonas sp.]|nr:hypothetical protein [Pseudomonas sp.]